MADWQLRKNYETALEECQELLYNVIEKATRTMYEADTADGHAAQISALEDTLRAIQALRREICDGDITYD